MVGAGTMPQRNNSQWAYPQVLGRFGFMTASVNPLKHEQSFLRILANRYCGGHINRRLLSGRRDARAPRNGAFSSNPESSLEFVGFAKFDGQLRLIDANKQLCCAFGQSRTKLLGRSFCQLFKVTGAAVRGTFDGDDHADLIWSEVQLLGEGEEHRLRQVLSIWRRNARNELASVLMYVGDLPASIPGLGRSLHTLDQTTGLLSTKEFAVELERAVERRSAKRGFALMLLSLDRFPTFNALFGRTNSDIILKEVVDRLRKTVDGHGMVGQIRPDEYAILFDAADATVDVAHQILTAVRLPYMVDIEEVVINATAGLALFPEHGTSADQLGRSAETALTHGKKQNSGVLQPFNEQIGRASLRRAQLERSLHQALRRGEFELEYQPRVDLLSMRIVAMEALIRWNHPMLGRIPPLDFIPVAEEIGLIGEIGRWALHTACAFASELTADQKPLRVSVNVSAQQLTDGRIADDIQFALAKSGLKPEFLELELTESMLVEDSERCADLLRRLKDIGVSLSIDDFGTGYSSLAYLQLSAVDAIKLDKTFVNRSGGGISNFRLVKALIDLAHALDVNVVAEGVESGEILRFLHASGCDEIQGYLVAHPLKPADFRRFLHTYVPCLEHLANNWHVPPSTLIAA